MPTPPLYAEQAKTAWSRVRLCDKRLREAEAAAAGASEEELLQNHPELLRLVRLGQADLESLQSNQRRCHEEYLNAIESLTRQRVGSTPYNPLPSFTDCPAVARAIIEAIHVKESPALWRQLDENVITGPERRHWIRQLAVAIDSASRHASYYKEVYTPGWTELYEGVMRGSRGTLHAELRGYATAPSAWALLRETEEARLAHIRQGVQDELRPAWSGRLRDAESDVADAIRAGRCAAWLTGQLEARRADHVEASARVARQALRDARAAVKHLEQEAATAFRESLSADYASSRVKDYAHRKSMQERLRRLQTRFVQAWVRRKGLGTVDATQAAALAHVHGHALVTARAGSGKTRAIVNRAAFLIEHCRTPPDAVMILAFNKKAVEEIESRLQPRGLALPHVLTFHALASRIVRPEKRARYDDPANEEFERSRLVQEVVSSLAAHPPFGARLRSVMIGHYREDWGAIVEQELRLPPAEGLAFRRALPHEGLDGRRYRSFGEKFTANFLFEHDIPYTYEKNRWWGGFNYRPDFTIDLEEPKVVIEYFGMEGTPDYDNQASRKRDYWKERPEWSLIELTPGEVARGHPEREDLLKLRLAAAGIDCRRLSEEAIWGKVRPRAVTRFAKMAAHFVGRCRKAGLSPEALRDRIAAHHPLNGCEAAFLDLGAEICREYLSRLQAEGEDDFDGLLTRAAANVESGQNCFDTPLRRGDLSGLRFLMIDEFQDFSPLFASLVSAIRGINPSLQVFAVGDDWQAINGFAGADVRLFSGFGEDYPDAAHLSLATNYRSAPAVVHLGNAIMAGRGVESRPDKSGTGCVLVANLSDVIPGGQELARPEQGRLTLLLRRVLAQALAGGKRVALLSRTNTLPPRLAGRWARLEDCQGECTEGLTQPEKDRVCVSTAHKYKGLEADTVVVIDAVESRYPMIHPDWVFTRLFGDTIEGLIEAERRLFYVACTRAVETLILVTDAGEESRFVHDTEGRWRAIDWRDFPPPPIAEPSWVVRVGTARGRGDDPWGTFPVRKLLAEDGFSWMSGGWKHWVKLFPQEGELGQFLDQLCSTRRWASQGKGLELHVLDQGDRLLGRYRLDSGLRAPIICQG